MRGVKRAPALAVLLWIVAILGAGGFVARLGIDTDMAAFLPRTPSPAQRVLVDQLQDGVLSRLVLVAIEGVPVARSSAIDRRLAAALRAMPEILAVANGEAAGFARDRELLWANRYLLSEHTDAAQFTAAGLRAALTADLAALGTTAGFLTKHTLDADPTGALLHLLGRLGTGEGTGGGMGEGGPARHDGVWVSPDRSRALLLVRLRAGGADIDGAQQGLAAIRTAFAAAASDPATSGDQAATLILSGPPVFAVAARDRIKADATRLSTIASLLVAAALLAVYRSPLVLALAFVPVASGALAGVAAVGLAFGRVHGITLGFGATLIGEAVDYAVYLFTQTPPIPTSPEMSRGDAVQRTLTRIWPVLRLGALTSICGFAAMLLSSFDGFVQLGLFTIAGLAVALGVTRWVLPALLPRRFAGVVQPRVLMRLATLIATLAQRGRRLRPAVTVLGAAAATALVFSLGFGHGAFWAGDLSSLSPVPAAAQRLDQSLRRDLRAADTGLLVVIRAPDQEAALQAAERLAAALVPLVQPGALAGGAPGGGALAGFDTPSAYLPSRATQRARQAALPAAPALQAALDTAAAGLAFQPGLFAPFAAAIAAARQQAPVERADLDGTSLALRLDSLLLHRPSGADPWTALLPLRGVTDPAAVAGAIAAVPGSVLLDLKAESNRLLGVYLREGVSLAGLGAAAICLLLLVSLRSWRRLLEVVAPLAAAVVVTLAVLRLGGHALSIFNLFGLLLVVAIGSNYGLFFDRYRADQRAGLPASPGGLPRVLASLLLANGCTVAGFGVLAWSQTPVLHDLGLPVSIGTFLSLVFASIMMSPPNLPAAAS